MSTFRGVEAAEIELDPTGVTVITGPNEIGKTSVLDAVTFAFTYPDNSRDRRLLAAKPVHRDEGPFVEVELTTGPYHLVFSKRWLKRPAKSLHVLAPRPENLTGRQAHDRFEAILDETLDRTLLSALHYQQGVTIQQAALGESSSKLVCRARCGDIRWQSQGREGGQPLGAGLPRAAPVLHQRLAGPSSTAKTSEENRRAQAETKLADLEKRVAGIEGTPGCALSQYLAFARTRAATRWRAAKTGHRRSGLACCRRAGGHRRAPRR